MIGISFIFKFVNSQIKIPVGNATIIARHNTCSVLSKIDRVITLPHFGTLYGGSSKVNDEVSPFNIVLDSSFETKNVDNILNNMISKNIKIPFIELQIPSF